jgi:hypothetical protein
VVPVVCAASRCGQRAVPRARAKREEERHEDRRGVERETSDSYAGTDDVASWSEPGTAVPVRFAAFRATGIQGVVDVDKWDRQKGPHGHLLRRYGFRPERVDRTIQPDTPCDHAPPSRLSRS